MLMFTQLCLTFCDPQDCSKPGFLSFTISLSLLRLMSIKSMTLSNHLISHPPFPPALNLCQHQGLYQLVGFCIRWPKYWSLSFSISPFNEYAGLISFRIDWFDLLLVQGSLKSLLQQHSSKASILQHSLLYGPTLTSVQD